MKHITVRTVSSSGNASGNNRVAVFVYQFMASGMKDPVHTNTAGEAHISLDVDEGAEIAIYINGTERVGRGSIQSVYTVTV